MRTHDGSLRTDTCFLNLHVYNFFPGEFMSRYMYGMAEDTEVQKYDMGDLMGTRKYNSAKDWSKS